LLHGLLHGLLRGPAASARFQMSMSARPSSAAPPHYRSKLANIFGTRLIEAGTPLQPGSNGFMHTANGATMMTPRGAVAGLHLRPGAPPAGSTSPRGQSYRGGHTVGSPRGGYSTLSGANVSPRSPRDAAAISSARRMRPATAGMRHSSPRAEHMKRESEIRDLIGQAQERIAYNQQREKMKRLMQSIANDKEEVPIQDLLLTAELANIPMSEAQRDLFFRTPYADRYAATFETASPRSTYGLECAPRSVKWRAFDEALQHSKLQSAQGVEAALNFYASKEAKAIADQKQRDEEARQLAAARAAAGAAALTAKPKGISDEQLRMVHKVVKQRLSTQFAEIRTAFRTFDKDHSGNISASECTDALLSLNVGLPRKMIDHLVNVADYDRDGEINYQEFARILTCDDITKIKREGAEEEGLVVATTQWYDQARGLKKSEMQNAQTKMRDMLMDRGGLTKMFRVIDEDKSGACSRGEMRQLVLNLNLEAIVRPPVIEELINLMDVDGDGSIMYKEFARVITADDIFNMEKLRQKAPEEAVKKPLTKSQKKAAAKRSSGF
jgi:Ca2+-binding EF-hand superfamily protein